MGVLCITAEYRHKTITTSLVLVPVRSRALLAKVIATAVWSILLALLSLVAVAAVALPWNAALGGVTSQVTDQVGAVVPGLLASAVLLGLFGLGFGTLVKNQVAAILLTIGGTLILESILIALARSIFHYNLNWLPNGAGAALAGDIARGFGGGGDRGTGLRLLAWWQGGLAMLAWGLIPLTAGYFTTFRRDVT
jgi:ABC-type transport system involved in multi-copper enzyme maturation permease subunit